MRRVCTEMCPQNRRKTSIHTVRSSSNTECVIFMFLCVDSSNSISTELEPSRQRCWVSVATGDGCWSCELALIHRHGFKEMLQHTEPGDLLHFILFQFHSYLFILLMQLGGGGGCSFLTVVKEQEVQEKKKMRGDGWMDAVVGGGDGAEEEGRSRFPSLLHQYQHQMRRRVKGKKRPLVVLPVLW